MTNLNFNADLESNISSYNTAGEVIFTENNLYLIKTDGSKIKYSSIEAVSSLPSTGIPFKIYILSTDFSLNYYDSSWHVLGGSNQIAIGTVAPNDTTKLWLDTSNINSPVLKWYNGASWINISGTSSDLIVSDKTASLSTQVKSIKFDGDNISVTQPTADNIVVKVNEQGNIGTKQVDETGLNNGMIPVFDTVSGKYKSQVILSGSSNPTGNGISQPLSNISMAQGDTKILNHVALTNNKVYFNVFEEILGGITNDIHNDFSNASNYMLQDSEKTTIASGSAKLNVFQKKYDGSVLPTAATPVWTEFYGAYITTKAIVSNTLHLINNSTDYSYYSIDMTQPTTAIITVEYRMKVLSGWGKITISEGANRVDIGMYPNKLTIFNGTTFDILVGTDFTQFHTFRYIKNGSTNWTLYLDGLLVYTSTVFSSSTIHEIRLINGTSSESYWDYVNWDTIGNVIFTSNPNYIITSWMSNYTLFTINKINFLTIPITTPTNTSVKLLCSFDNRVNWLYHDVTGWHKYTEEISLNWINSNTNIELQSYFSNLTIFQLTTDLSSLGIIPTNIDFNIQLMTTDSTVTPTISAITMNYLTNTRYEQATIGRMGSTMDYGLQRISDSQTIIKRQSPVINGTTSNVIVNMFDGN